MENLEQQLIGSRKVREFLKHFSESQWSRVLKATVIMGIQELERSNKIHSLSCKDLEDIVGKLECVHLDYFQILRHLVSSLALITHVSS